MELSKNQQFAMDMIKDHGGLIRYPGGYWSYPNCEMVKAWGTPWPETIPRFHIPTLTVRSLINKGLIKAVAFAQDNRTHKDYMIKVEKS